MSSARNILLAVRVGEASRAPGRTAAWLAAELGARVTILYAAAELETVGEVALGAGLDESAVRERMVAEAREKVEAWAREVFGDVPFEVAIEQGEVADCVAAAAARLEADLVVVGSQTRGALRDVILGDTTREILRKSPCPVVVAPAR